MSRLAGFSAREVGRVAERLGWQLERQSGSHLVYVPPSQGLPILVVPNHRELRPGTVRALIRAMGIDVDTSLQIAGR